MKYLKWMYLFLAIGCAICSLISTTMFSTIVNCLNAGLWFASFYLEVKRGKKQ